MGAGNCPRAADPEEARPLGSLPCASHVPSHSALLEPWTRGPAPAMDSVPRGTLRRPTHPAGLLPLCGLSLSMEALRGGRWSLRGPPPVPTLPEPPVGTGGGPREEGPWVPGWVTGLLWPRSQALSPRGASYGVPLQGRLTLGWGICQWLRRGRGHGGPRPVPHASGVDAGCPAASRPACCHEEGGLTSLQPPASFPDLRSGPPRSTLQSPPRHDCPRPISQTQKPQPFGARHDPWTVP